MSVLGNFVCRSIAMLQIYINCFDALISIRLLKFRYLFICDVLTITFIYYWETLQRKWHYTPGTDNSNQTNGLPTPLGWTDTTSWKRHSHCMRSVILAYMRLLVRGTIFVYIRFAGICCNSSFTVSLVKPTYTKMTIVYIARRWSLSGLWQ